MKKTYLTLLALCGLCTTVSADDWMEPLPDATYVSVLSIPGTHDTATNKDMSLASFSQTQDIDIATQWSIGIRAFDMRPKVSGDHLAIYHGIADTKVRFDDALYQLRDSLIKSPSEFAIIHLLYADNYDKEKDSYNTMLHELTGRDDLKDFFIDFRPNLTVGDMRGKILLLSRDTYDTTPIGGFFRNWCGWIDWNSQTNGQIIGPNGALGKLYMQDLADTHESGKLEEKMNAIKTMLDFSTQHQTLSESSIVWVYNFASAYSKVMLGSISTADGYRDNAAHTNATIIDYLDTHEAGPTGIILMDYAGVDESNGYQTRGKELVEKIIANNFKYLKKETAEDRALYKKYQEVMARIDELKDLRTSTYNTIRKECKDVYKEFTSDLNAIRSQLTKLGTDTKNAYEAGEFTMDYPFDGDAIENELNAILQRARARQKEYEDFVAGIESTKTTPTGISYRIYSITGELLDAPRRGAINIFKYSDGTVRKIQY